MESKRKKAGLILLGLIVFLIFMGCGGCQKQSCTEEERRNEKESMMEKETVLENMSQTVCEVDIDFSVRTDPPLIKKFGFFNSGLVSESRTEKDLPLMDPLYAESLRIELGMGRHDMIFHDLVMGEKEQLEYHFDGVDRLADRLTKQKILPYWAYGYCPYPLQEGEDCRAQPAELEKWQEILCALASHFKENGIRIGYHEVWNEPDCGTVFYTGSWEDYCQLYAYGVRGLRQGDPDAVVGGPSTAWVANPGNRYKDFLAYVENENLPLDFFSMHSYGMDYRKRIENVRGELESFGERFATTSIHVNEMNNVNAPWNYGGMCDQYKLVPCIFGSIEGLLEENDVEVVSWAQFSESGVDALGVINKAGQKKAAYHAFEIYARMPVKRYSLEVSSPQIRGMASADENRAGAVIWNNTFSEQSIRICLKNVPFSTDKVDIYRIDEENCVYKGGIGNELMPVESFEIDGAQEIEWTGVLSGYGTLYLEYNAPEESCEEETINASIVRKEQYYPCRGTDCYAYFDEKTWTAWLGTGTDSQAHAVTAVLTEEMPQIIRIYSMLEGNQHMMTENACVGVRLDYETDAGFQKAVLFHGGILGSSEDRKGLWGTEPAPDIIETVDLSSFVIDVPSYAPQGWNGRVLLRFELRDCGENIRAEFRVRQE